MIRDVNFTAAMSNKEMMFVVSSEWIDEICTRAVNAADELMSNPYIKKLVVQAAEQKLSYEDKRKKVMLGSMENDFWYTTAEKDWKSYKTVLYDVIFSEFGANNHNV